MVDDTDRAIARGKWEANHPGKKPEEEGLLIRCILVAGRGMVECVRALFLEDDEWCVNLQYSMHACITQTGDDGSMTLREGQQEAKSDSHCWNDRCHRRPQG